MWLCIALGELRSCGTPKAGRLSVWLTVYSFIAPRDLTPGIKQSSLNAPLSVRRRDVDDVKMTAAEKKARTRTDRFVGPWPTPTGPGHSTTGIRSIARSDRPRHAYRNLDRAITILRLVSVRRCFRCDIESQTGYPALLQQPAFSARRQTHTVAIAIPSVSPPVCHTTDQNR